MHLAETAEMEPEEKEAAETAERDRVDMAERDLAEMVLGGKAEKVAPEWAEMAEQGLEETEEKEAAARRAQAEMLRCHRLSCWTNCYCCLC